MLIQYIKNNISQYTMQVYPRDIKSCIRIRDAWIFCNINILCNYKLNVILNYECSSTYIKIFIILERDYYVILYI